MSNLDQFTTVLGILGAYFAILLVMAVSVESILEPFSAIPGLRKKLDPDDILNDIQGWLPEGEELAAKALAIQELTENSKVAEEALLKTVEDLKPIAEEALAKLGPDSKVTQAHKDLALKFAALRRKYATTERQRITILRVTSAAIGMIIAVLLQVDTFNILGVLFPENVRAVLTQPGAQIGGMLITGLAASAGSSFWHDMLGRARSIKETAQALNQ